VFRIRRYLPAFALVALLLAGCGDGGDSAGNSVKTQPVNYLSGGASDLERQLGNTFRKGLYRLAVMGQPTDDAADLGQQLPTGVLDGMSCATSMTKPSGDPWKWSCTARWQTPEGRAEKTRYAAEVTGGGCIYAQSDPPLPQVNDVTIKAPAEHPLSSLVVPIKGC
jgi:hypothetical protein